MSDIAGGQFRLTCGQIGAGKSYLYVRMVELEAKKSGKYQHIYSNIRAHAELAEGITPMPDDWRDCETDSLIIIDEVQMHEKFSKHFSSRRDSEIAGLTMIRHKRQDIWMISPNPALVNSDVRNLVNQYFWLEPVGKKTTKCYCFDKVYTNITKSVKKQAYDEFSYDIQEKYYSLYKSTEDGKASGRNFNLNMKLIGFIVGMAVVCLIIAGLVMYLSKDTKTKVEDIQNIETKNNNDKKNKESDQSMGVLPVTGDISVECRKGVNIDKPECKQWYENLTKNNGSAMGSDQNYQVSYNPNKPFDNNDIQKNISYEVTVKPVFSGCMKKNGRYVAYTQQGTILHDVSQSDCQRLMNGDRPFNYFAQNKIDQTDLTNIQKQSEVSTQINQPKKEFYADNQVQDHLQAQTVNGANQL